MEEGLRVSELVTLREAVGLSDTVGEAVMEGVWVSEVEGGTNRVYDIAYIGFPFVS